jgi:glycyl-radical enzyme activating protein
MKYFDIVWSSQKDGPGIRTVLFLQGCNLHCAWCHSPHSQFQSTPILFYKEYCKYCGKCAEVCTAKNHSVTPIKHMFDRTNCTNCGKCILNCSNKALESRKYESTPSTIFEKIKAELILLKNIGGITVSGGEPLLQYVELKELLMLCNDFDIHTAVETAGSVDKVCFEQLYNHVDCWLFDLKQTNANLCKKYTGGNINVIIDNLNFLAMNMPKKIIIRTPVIGGFTDDLPNIQKIADIMLMNNLKNIELLPYNQNTSHYYKSSGLEFNEKRFTIPTESQLNSILNLFKNTGINAILVR